MMNVLPRLAVGFSFLLALSSPSEGQLLPDSLLDRRVRLHLVRQARSIEGAVDRQMLRGTVSAVTTDSVTIQIHPAASGTSVAITGIHQIDISRGVSRSRTALKAGIGVAALSGLQRLRDMERGGHSTNDVLMWAAGGFVLGGVFGLLLPAEQWKRVYRR
jgi:hypothetical protein